MKRLRSAKYGGQCLNRNAHDVVVWLLSGQRASRCLCMEAKNGGFRILAAESLGHHPVPHFSRSPILGDFLEKIVVGVEEKRQPWRKVVHIQAGAPCPF